MRIVSLNLRGFVDWDARLPLIVDYLKRQKPSVALFQEVVYLPDHAPRPQLDLLAEALATAGAGFAHSHSSVSRLQSSTQYGAYREGLGILSSLPVTSSETIILLREEGDPHNRLVQFFDVRDSDTTWKFANVHLSIRDDFAIHQLEEVLSMMDARGEKRIVGGDFNTNFLERHAHLWRDGYVLTTEIEKYVSFVASDQANDYFLVPKEYELTAIAVSGDGLSDHRALSVEIVPRG
jgi:endonuclease/exonuclease/phosphatase family metal-dependent hydrolase